MSFEDKTHSRGGYDEVIRPVDKQSSVKLDTQGKSDPKRIYVPFMEPTEPTRWIWATNQLVPETLFIRDPRRSIGSIGAQTKTESNLQNRWFQSTPCFWSRFWCMATVRYIPAEPQRFRAENKIKNILRSSRVCLEVESTQYQFAWRIYSVSKLGDSQLT